MSRRRFLGLTGLILAALIGSGYSLFSRRLACKKLSWGHLPDDVQALYQEDFLNAFPDIVLEDLIVALCDRGVYSWNGVQPDRIRGNAAHDSLIQFNELTYTKSELLLYAAVARLHARDSD